MSLPRKRLPACELQTMVATEVNLSDEEKEKVIEEVKQSEWANLIVFDEY